MSQLQTTVTLSGRIGFNWNTTWGTVHDASSATSDTSHLTAWSDSISSDGAYGIYRSFLVWDTSSIPDDAIISSALLELHSGDASAPGTNTVHIVTNNQASNTGLADGDYDQLGGSSLGSFAPNTGAGYAISVSIPVANISKTGYTKLGLRQYYDFVNSPPPYKQGENRQNFDGLGASYPARLTITYTTVPAVTTGAASALQPISATLAGEVTDIGGGTVSERGVCWATTANPTTASSKATSVGGLGSYTINATGLLPGTLYHYRSYVITENSTQYGADVSFRTPGGAILFNLL